MSYKEKITDHENLKKIEKTTEHRGIYNIIIPDIIELGYREVFSCKKHLSGGIAGESLYGRYFVHENEDLDKGTLFLKFDELSDYDDYEKTEMTVCCLSMTDDSFEDVERLIEKSMKKIEVVENMD